jgi:hypothetical protein
MTKTVAQRGDFSCRTAKATILQVLASTDGGIVIEFHLTTSDIPIGLSINKDDAEALADALRKCLDFNAAVPNN